MRGSDLPGQGEEIFVNVDGIIAFGTIAWANGLERGIGFDAPLSAADERLLRHRVALERGVKPEMKAAFEDWSVGLAR